MTPRWTGSQGPCEEIHVKTVKLSPNGVETSQCSAPGAPLPLKAEPKRPILTFTTTNTAAVHGLLSLLQPLLPWLLRQTTRTESHSPHAAPASSPFTASVSAPAVHPLGKRSPLSHLHLVSDKRFAL